MDVGIDKQLQDIFENTDRNKRDEETYDLLYKNFDFLKEISEEEVKKNRNFSDFYDIAKRLILTLMKIILDFKDEKCDIQINRIERVVQ